MANSLTFTSAAIAQNTAFASGATTETTILSADTVNTRRIYGIAFTNSASQSITCTIRVKDDSNNPAGNFSVSLTTGANVMTDIFGNTNGAPLFQKKRDANGNAYYDLPANWTITAQLSGNSTNSAYIHVFGETYA
jgi:uncharacterized membrane protein YecN with MAPEG domain